jgi:hypothetical protein
MVYEHEVVSPWEVNNDSRRISFQDQLIANGTEDVIHHGLQALKNMMENKARVVKYYNKKVVSKQFEEGDLAWKI